MKTYVKCIGIEAGFVLFKSEDVSVVVTIAKDFFPNVEFKVGHEYELLLTK